MATDHIRYDVLARDALRGVLRRVLTDAAEHGLPGEHHFFITFLSTADGVKLSPRLLAQYPEEMTIILQHQFWDLTVTEDRFEVGLSFGGIPERLVVPFNSIKSFFDPSVQFGLQFETSDAAAESAAASLPAVPAPAPVPALTRARAGRRKTGQSRPSRAKAPRSSGWIASARNNRTALRKRRPHFLVVRVRSRRTGTRFARKRYNGPDPWLDRSLPRDPVPPAPRPTASARSRSPPIATGARRPNGRGGISASATTGCRCRSFARSASSSSPPPKPIANSGCSTGAAPAPSSAPRAR